MQTSRFFRLSVSLLAAVLCAVTASGCIDGSTCLRNSDCPAADVCSIGACIVAPSDGEGGLDEGGVGEAGAIAETGTQSDSSSGVDATLSDAGHGDSDAAATDAADDGANDAADDGAADAASE